MKVSQSDPGNISFGNSRTNAIKNNQVCFYTKHFQEMAITRCTKHSYKYSESKCRVLCKFCEQNESDGYQVLSAAMYHCAIEEMWKIA